MNAIHNARPPAPSAVAAPEANARNRQGAPEAGGDAFEQMLASRAAPSQADGETSSFAAASGDGASNASPIALPQALADLLREAMKGGSDEDGDDAPADLDANADAAPTPIVAAAPALPVFAAAASKAMSGPAADAAPARAPQAALPPQVLADEGAGDDGGAEGARADGGTGAARPERSSIMSTLDQALQAPRPTPPPERSAADEGGASPRREAIVEGVDATTAADEGVKVSFVSMSRSPAPVIAPAEAAPVERPQTAAPPAPPPPPTAAAQHLRLVMEPSGLGAVALHLSLSEARVSVDLEAQRSETRHKLEAGRDQLVESLTGAGYDVAHVQVKTAATEAGFDPARRDGAATSDAPSERAQQQRDESSRGDDHEAKRGDHADDPRARPHRSGGVFI